ncbi:hypothetical protein ACE01N_02330 [Saccharicrinis sp. FJH2]|uniref:hypothetical protein n=1 Tax=Saccharicrinis sp. FJH65 TaxID=3344659 RepID=UPI0035F41BEF
MANDKQSRKSFLKRIGLTLGAAAVAQLATASDIGYMKDDKLNDVQKDFLQTYEKWLGEFHGFVKKQKADFTNLENNKKLMALSAEAEEWKKQLEVHMLDERFSRYHEKITRKVTEEIA